MNKTGFLLVSLVALTFSVSCAFGTSLTDPPPVAVIFDTDMGPDYDDVGALAVLHALADSGECTILATVASDAHPLVAPTIDVINRYFQRGDLPIGRAVDGAPDFVAPNGWNDSLVYRFGPELISKEYPPAVAVYRQALANQPDGSVTIVTVGFLSNLSALLQSEADQYSPLNGVDLVRKKVKQLVAMAGAFPNGIEFNVNEHASAAAYTVDNWPTPILFSGFEIGSRIFTGASVARSDASGSCPVASAYEYNLRTFAPGGEQSRPSWDQTAVLVAIRDAERYFYVNGPGKFSVSPDGTNQWNPEEDRPHYFLTHKYPLHVIEFVIEQLMLHKPAK